MIFLRIFCYVLYQLCLGNDYRCYDDNMSNEDYSKARKKGEKAFRQAVAAGKYPYLPVLDEVLGPQGGTLSVSHVGIYDVPLSKIVGTRTAGRQNAFAGNYMPLLDEDTEFAFKWMKVFDYQMDNGIADPIEAYEFMHKFYVQEGNKRVSVLKYLDVPSIECDVYRVLPQRSDDEAVRVYYEFLEFFKVCPTYEITFTKPGSYAEFAAHLGRDLKTPWPSDAVHATEAGYYRFYTVYRSLGGTGEAGDALLVYLNVYSFSSLLDTQRMTLTRRVQSMLGEISLHQQADPVALMRAPREAARPSGISLLTNLLRRPPSYTESSPLKAAFIYPSDPDHDGRVNDEEVGRIYLSHAFEGIVETKPYFNASDSKSLAKALFEAVDLGQASAVFTTDASMLNGTLQKAVACPGVDFLNCSIHSVQQAVRTYQCRMYEVKFLMGALAALSCTDDQIGYVADRPVYGEAANINAFAIGASMIRPKARIYLVWGGRKNSDWKKEFADRKISIISGPDFAAESGEPDFGLFQVDETGAATSLAVPIFNWGRYYELIVKTMLDHSYDDDPSAAAGKSLSYWYGLSEGVIDLHVADSLDPSMRKMIRLLRKGVADGAVHPFQGILKSQNGIVQDREDALLSDEKVITMDWLNENVIGRMPEVFSA